MEPVLDELTLRPCDGTRMADRIRRLAGVVKRLDGLGAARVLRSVSDAALRDVGGGMGLNRWCFEESVDRDAGRLVGARLDKQPYIDGPGGLFGTLEKGRAIDPSCDGSPAVGLGYCHLTGGFALGLGGSELTGAFFRDVSLYCVDEAGDYTETSRIRLLLADSDVEDVRDDIVGRINGTIASGEDILARGDDLLPHLRFGSRAVDQLREMRGSEPHFAQVVRHLRTFEVSALDWYKSGEFAPAGITYSAESQATLQHGRYGPLRRFPTPDGFAEEQWSLHSKVAVGSYRIYFRHVAADKDIFVLVGYVGPHLPTVDYPN